MASQTVYLPPLRRTMSQARYAPLHIDEWLKLNDKIQTILIEKKEEIPLEDLFGAKKIKGKLTYKETAFHYMKPILSYLMHNYLKKDIEGFSLLSIFKPIPWIHYFNKTLDFTFTLPFIPTIERILTIHTSYFAPIIKQLDSGTPIVVSFAIVGLMHGVAIIAWKEGTKHCFGFYDPQWREEFPNLFTTEDYNLIYLFIEYVRHDGSIIRGAIQHSDFINLSTQCPLFTTMEQTQKKRCPQYYYDAEYCHIYALQFIVHFTQLIKQSSAIPITRDVINNTTTNAIYASLYTTPENLSLIGRKPTLESYTYNAMTMFHTALVLLLHYYRIVYIFNIKKEEKIFLDIRCGLMIIFAVIFRDKISELQSVVPVDLDDCKDIHTPFRYNYLFEEWKKTYDALIKQDLNTSSQ